MNQSTSSPERKLAAIMFTDIVGYSRIMSLDETKAFKLLDQHDKILQAIIEEHQGKVLKKMGDAFFVEFASSVNAVNCATNIQESLKEFNETRDSQDQIIIRIGIHLGDVIIHGDDLFGEGINVAARLEPLAPPGGICMSQAVYQSVSSQTELVVHSLGEIELKNIVEKYTVYTIPSFYVEHNEDSPRPEQKETTLDFTIKKIQRLPSVSRTYWAMVGLYALILIGVFSVTVVISFSWMDNPHHANKINLGEIINRTELLMALQDTSDHAASNIFNQLHVGVQKLIIEHSTSSSISDSVIKIIRREMNKQIESDHQILPDGILKSINLPQHIQEHINNKPPEKSVSHINRLIVGFVFNGKITESPIPYFWWVFEYALPELSKFVSIKMFLGFILFFAIGTLGAGYATAHATMRITFISIRHIDSALEYFTEQMGFKPPFKAKGYLVYKPTARRLMKDILLTDLPVKIKVRADGNSVVIISTIPVVNRLEKQFKAYGSGE